MSATPLETKEFCKEAKNMLCIFKKSNMTFSAHDFSIQSALLSHLHCLTYEISKKKEIDMEF